MADIPITDNVSASASLRLNDDAELAQAKLSHLLSMSKSLISELQQPVDVVDLSSVSLGLTVMSPSALVADVLKLTAKSGINGTLSILRSKDQSVFADEDPASAVPIGTNECWTGVELDTTIGANAGAGVDGFSFGVALSSAVRSSTYTLFASTAGKFPTLQHALEGALNNFEVLHSADTIRAQKPGTINVTETSGTVKFSGSYSLPINVSALASVDLPFQYNISVTPAAEMKIAGQIALSGSFRVRCLKTGDGIVQLSLDKKKGTNFSVSFSAGVGVSADVGSTDLISAFLGSVMPSVDPKASGLTAEDSEKIRQVLNDSIDRSLSISINTACSATLTDESAVVYSLDLNKGDAQQTDRALAAALSGDWTGLAALPNARPLRNVVSHTEAHKTQMVINLLGFYNASTVNSYAKSCTVLRDENGRLFVMDKAKASSIATASMPYLADDKRLRMALVEASVASVTYAATNSGALAHGVGADLKIQQQYFRYDDSMSRQEFHDEILLGTALGLIERGTWDGVLNASAKFGHVRVSASATYDNGAALAVFFADPGNRTCRSDRDLSAVARASLASLIDASDPAGQVRLTALRSDAVWQAMDKCGNVGAFSTIAYLSHLNTTELGAISTDWTDVRWWVDSMLNLGPAMAAVLAAVDQVTSDPSADPLFMKRRGELLNALQDVVRKSKAAFADGWGLAVLYALAKGAPRVSMDVAWAGGARHFESIAAVPLMATAPS